MRAEDGKTGGLREIEVQGQVGPKAQFGQWQAMKAGLVCIWGAWGQCPGEGWVGGEEARRLMPAERSGWPGQQPEGREGRGRGGSIQKGWPGGGAGTLDTLSTCLA